MTRYEQLCDLYVRARERGDAHRERCALLLDALRDRLVAYLEMPDDALAFRPVESEPDEAAPGPLREAMSASDDGTWHVGAQVKLHDAAHPEAPFLLFFDVRVREEEGRFRVSLSDDDPGRPVQPDDPAGLDGIAADLDRRLESWLVDHLDRVLGAAGKIERFGVYL